MPEHDRQTLYEALCAIQHGTSYFDEILTLEFPQARPQVSVGGQPSQRALQLLQWAESQGEEVVERLGRAVARRAPTTLSAEPVPTMCEGSLSELTSKITEVTDEGYIQANEPNTPDRITLVADQYQDPDRKFAAELRAQMAAAGKIIDALTADQYRIIEWLRGHQRATISGCAGSGKTLVAIEKAIRMDKAGLRTLFLCHSPYLANHLAKLACRSGIRICDFARWVADINDKAHEQDGQWTHYEEPTDFELEMAFDRLSTSSRYQYDAIVVDEGQDFREIWWLLIEHALLTSGGKILYIFHDDNQSLLPMKSKIPIHEAPFTMSKNCRNAGQIFDVVRQMHIQAPDPSILLFNHGIFEQTLFSDGEEAAALGYALERAMHFSHKSPVVVLTTELGSAEQSVLHSMQVMSNQRHDWQTPVCRALQFAVNRLVGRHMRGPIPTLSDAPHPTQYDIYAVTEFARAYSSALRDAPPANVTWRLNEGRLILRGAERPSATLNFFASESWAAGIPSPQTFLIQSMRHTNVCGESPIALWTVDGFKGLEADSAILFVQGIRPDFDANIYVGISRARLYLHLIANVQIASRLPFGSAVGGLKR
jgi:hypothetical protein